MRGSDGGMTLKVGRFKGRLRHPINPNIAPFRAVQAEQTQNTAVDWGDTVGEGGHSIKTEPQLVEGNEIESVI